MDGVRRSFGDPAAEQVDLRGVRCLAAFLRRHEPSGSSDGDAFEQGRCRRACPARRRVRRSQFGEAPSRVSQPQFRLALLGVGSVAGEAVIRQDGPNVAVETDLGFVGAHGCVVKRTAAKDSQKPRREPLGWNCKVIASTPVCPIKFLLSIVEISLGAGRADVRAGP